MLIRAFNGVIPGYAKEKAPIEIAVKTVSVIINNYNYGQFLEECLNSVLEQSCHPFEIIVVDDGSTDASRDILKRYAEGIKLVLKENGGQASAMNAGFCASKGDWVLFLDADDSLVPGALERIKERLSAEFTKVHYRMTQIGPKGQIVGAYPPARLPLEEGCPMKSVRQLGYYVTSPNSGNVFNRKFLEEIMPIPEATYRICADTWTLFSNLEKQNICAVEEQLGLYRVHKANMWHRTSFFDTSPGRTHAQLTGICRRMELLSEQQIKVKGMDKRQVAECFLDLVGCKVALLALRTDPAALEWLPAIRRLYFRIALARIDRIEGCSMRWLEWAGLYLLRYAPLASFPMLQRLEICLKFFKRKMWVNR